MRMVRFLPDGLTVRVPAGTTLLAAARQAGLVIEAPCDGVGTCGKCKVRLPGGAEGVTRNPGRHRLTAAEEAQGWILACEARVAADLEVETPAGDAGRTLRITRHGRAAAVALEPFVRKAYDAAAGETLVFGGDWLLGREAGNTTGELFGLAVDIGTTTLVVALVDLAEGRELAAASALNPQALHAQDVLSRIRFAGSEAGLAQMQREVLTALDTLTAEVAAAAGVERSRIYEAVFSGNTCMLHLAAGVSPASLGKAPYTPELTGGCHRPAALLGLRMAPFGLVYLPPVISAYVGADLTAGIQATGLDQEQRTVLLVDIGTNGEMVLVHDGRLYAASTAAGPAFEGMNIACGMRAGEGAIERFVLEEDGAVGMEVIGGGAATGICGSGLLDIVAELVQGGVITSAGGFLPITARLPTKLQERLGQREGKPVFVLDETVYLSRGDIRQVQLAKGAIRAGIEVLLRHAGIAAAGVEQVLIAGSFGYHLRPESLLTLGLLPEDFAGRIEFVGNTSKTGGQAFLLNRACRVRMEGRVAQVEVVELAAAEGFDKVFVACLGF